MKSYVHGVFYLRKFGVLKYFINRTVNQQFACLPSKINEKNVVCN